MGLVWVAHEFLVLLPRRALMRAVTLQQWLRAGFDDGPVGYIKTPSFWRGSEPPPLSPLLVGHQSLAAGEDHRPG